MDFTAQQLRAIERREGDLLVDAGAGSGKTSVLVERFVRAVMEDRVDVGAILTITFTDKAAAQLRDRIRGRLRECGAHEAARATEGAFISTIHGFCARLLRAHALVAGLDPAFTVLDQLESERIADAAFEESLEALAQSELGAVELIASYGAGALREAILATHGELRSRGARLPELPQLPAASDLEAARHVLEQAAMLAARELGTISAPSARVLSALGALERGARLIATGDPWPGEVRGLSLPGGNGAALRTSGCLAYGEALERFRVACEHRRALPARDLLDRLLRSFGTRYAQRKRERSGLDFEDLELMARGLLTLNRDLCERYARRFAQIMVDEMQDTNQVQLELIESIARGNLFTVGDAQQSIYGFRHADVALFQGRGKRLAESGARISLNTNYRSRREILTALNGAFAAELGESFTALMAGRSDEPAADEPLVELLIIDKGADWTADSDGLASPWRLAEARVLALRVLELIEAGASPGDVVVLTRATSDLRVYERALEQHGIPTYMIGGRGYWSHPQVVDLVAYLRALANPRDEEALYTVLSSPLVGLSLDAVVLLAAGARAAGRDPWWTAREPEERLDELAPEDRLRLSAFVDWFAGERGLAGRASVEQLIDRALDATGYDLAMLAMAGGERRLANVRKLMRLGREHELSGGRDLHGFVELVRNRTLGRSGSGVGGWGSGGGGSAEPRESEAPVEGETLGAVRLMTIHRSKGLEFEIVCVADLGRGPRHPADLLRVGRDGRFGLRLAQPGTGNREPALDYKVLGEERARAREREERRLFYVAMTRARERLILSGAAKLDCWPASSAGSPMAWIGPAFVPGIAAPAAERSGITDAGVKFTLIRSEDAKDTGDEDVDDRMHHMRPLDRPGPGEATATGTIEARRSPVARLSYSSLVEYKRCGYRFYVERVLGLPRVPDRREPASRPGAGGSEGPLSATDRGSLVHALLEQLDFRDPVAPSPAAVVEAAVQASSSRQTTAHAPSANEAAEIATLVGRFAGSDLAGRIGRASDIARELGFAFLLERDVLVTGALDVLAREPGNRLLVVDYKSDRLHGAEPRTVVQRDYLAQRVIYALAGIRAGAAAVEVVHVFLEHPDEPVVARFSTADAARLQRELGQLIAGVLEREFVVSDAPHRGLCDGCPAQGGLCSWPLAVTRRETPDRLF